MNGVTKIVMVVAMGLVGAGSTPAVEAQGGLDPRPAAPVWGPTVKIARGSIESAEIAVDERNVATVVFARFSGGVFAVRKRPGAAWQAPVKLGRGRRPHLVVDGAGNATTVWTGVDLRVQSASRPAKGRWHAARFLSPPTPGSEHVIVGAFDTDLAVNRAGDTVVAWDVWSMDDEGMAERVRARYRPAGHRWLRPVTLDGSTAHPAHPVVAVRPGGQALALYRTGRTLVAQDRLLGTGWSPQRLIDPTFDGAPVTVGVGTGSETAAWGHEEVDVSWRSRTGNWSPPLPVFGPGSVLAGMHVSADGNAIIAAVDADGVWSRRALTDGSLRRATLISPEGGYADATSMAGNARGDALLSWYQYDRRHPRTFAAYRPRGADWTADLEVVGGAPASAVLADGDALLVWARQDGDLFARRLSVP